MEGIWRPRIQGVDQRRREGREAHLLPAERQAQAGRNRGVLLHRVQVARASRSNQRQGHEGPAAGRHDGSEVDAFRRQAPDLRRIQETGLRLSGRAAQSSDEGPQPATITVDDTHRVSGLLQAPRGARACYVMAHGAGAGMAHPFMWTLANELAKRGIATLRYQFPYMEQGSKRPDTPKMAQATVRAAVAEASRLTPDLAPFAGGAA